MVYCAFDGHRWSTVTRWKGRKYHFNPSVVDFNAIPKQFIIQSQNILKHQSIKTHFYPLFLGTPITEYKCNNQTIIIALNETSYTGKMNKKSIIYKFDKK